MVGSEQLVHAMQTNTQALTEANKNVHKGSPAIFHGSDSECMEWAAKLRTNMITDEPKGGKYLKWAEASTDDNANATIANESFDDERVLSLSMNSSSSSEPCTSNEVVRQTASGEEGTGLSVRYQPRSPKIKRTILVSSCGACWISSRRVPSTVSGC